VAFAIFVGAMITDKIDGDIARARNLVTNFGKIADPIADKAITGMAFIGLSLVGDIWWWVTIVVLLREWSVTLLRLSVLRHVVIAANQSGKVKTVLQAMALGFLCLPLPHGDGAHAAAFERFGWPGEAVFYLGELLLAGAVVMTLWSGYEFFRDVWRQRASMRRAPARS
jgi:CDP-diacylglycerol--glycerol-3-phosphate 3-phosphatidyltransferase